MTDPIKLTILCEDQARMGFLDKKFSGQHGLSLFIQAGIAILFDTGPSPVILENADLAGIDLSTTDRIVLSHGHWDHCDGLSALAADGIHPPVTAHPGVFADRHKPTGEFNGMAMTRDQVEQIFGLTESKGPVRLAEKIWFLGEIPRITSFEAMDFPFWIPGAGGQKITDTLPDDTAIALATERGAVVITGCSHAGICNICLHAKRVTGQGRIHMVLGGFHLLQEGEQLDRTITFFQEERVDRLFPMHCTAFPALARFRSALGVEKLCTGDELIIAP